VRWLIVAIVFFLLGIGATAGWYAFIKEGVDKTSQANASAVVTTIAGGLAGALAGFVVGRTGS
jgi:hypothetical protein